MSPLCPWMVQIAASRGGRCLSTEYVNVETHLSWRCGEGHRWTATAASVRRGKWCPYCVHNHRLELKEMQHLARKRGGKCLSTRYINSVHPLLWECKRGHRWKAVPGNVKGGKRKRGMWCLECYNLRRRFRTKDSIERMERVARRRGGRCAFERLTGRGFGAPCQRLMIFENYRNSLEQRTAMPRASGEIEDHHARPTLRR
jgi:hypothetical protein